MTPLCVRARLTGAISANRPIALDALLMAAVATRDDMPPLAVVGEDRAPIEIPLARSQCGRLYLASWAEYEVEEAELRWINRKFPIAEAQTMMDHRVKSIKISAGPQKSHRIPMESFHVRGDELTWWCMGDAHAIWALLAHVSYLGRKRAVGLGEVRSWTIEACEAWPGFPLLRDGRPTRSLPIDWPDVGEHDRGYAVLTPPYWEHHREEECLMPLGGAR